MKNWILIAGISLLIIIGIIISYEKGFKDAHSKKIGTVSVSITIPDGMHWTEFRELNAGHCYNIEFSDDIKVKEIDCKNIISKEYR